MSTDPKFEAFEQNDAKLLLNWLNSDSWPWHGGDEKDNSNDQILLNSILNGAFNNDEVSSFWMLVNDDKVGFIKLFDLDDETPLFDLRILTKYRGQGLGKKALLWLTSHIFETYEHIIRIQGNTREDNIAMQKVFKACNYVKEAHYRQGWAKVNGRYLDAVAYAILKSDWLSGETTPIKWDIGL